MATSDSDDFESADEEIEFRDPPVRSFDKNDTPKWTSNAFDSDSDDDHCIADVRSNSWSSEVPAESVRGGTAGRAKDLGAELREADKLRQSEAKSSTEGAKSPTEGVNTDVETMENLTVNEEKEGASSPAKDPNKNTDETVNQTESKETSSSSRRQRPERQRREKPSKPAGLGAKKLGSKLTDAPRPPPEDILTPADIRRKAIEAGKEPPIIQECWEFDEDQATQILQKESQDKTNWSKGSKDSPDSEDIPEELKSNKSFKEVFKSDGWESFGDEEKILSELDDNSKEDKVKPVLDKLVDNTDKFGGWGGWGSWGVSSLLNTASVGVSTLTSHVSQGLSLLEESMGVPDPVDLASTPEQSDSTGSTDDKSASEPNQQQSQGGFGLGNFMSGVSQITKLVESTGSKVITGGLGTLETIGKKTMEVLQEGDPGLKKKRAFFMNEVEKPILSQMLREAKEKADVEEKTVEERQMARKVHFESLFDDYQGLVHLEALEMLSKQSNIKIQQKLVTLDADEMMSMQETLDEVKELCDLGEEDDEDEEEGDLKKLKSACSDLGVSINYDKLNEILEETKKYLENVSKPESTITDREIFQTAISTLARFTAYSVERFHKTAELLLVKERRSTVNEADALVQLTKILSGQIGTTASGFSKSLNERNKNEEQSKESNDITTIFLEATNASSYIQEAFRLLIPILQVGAI